MNARGISVDDKLYSEVLDLRYNLFFKEHGLPRSILFDKYEND